MFIEISTKGRSEWGKLEGVSLSYVIIGRSKNKSSHLFSFYCKLSCCYWSFINVECVPLFGS